jgi:hypothetical protein
VHRSAKPFDPCRDEKKGKWSVQSPESGRRTGPHRVFSGKVHELKASVDDHVSVLEPADDFGLVALNISNELGIPN